MNIVSTKQLITSIKNYAVSSKTLLAIPKKAVRRFRELLHRQFPKIWDMQTCNGAAMLAMPLVILLTIAAWLGEFLLDPPFEQAESAVFFEKLHREDQQENRLAQMESANKSLEKDAMLWLSLLGSYDDTSLSTEELMLKFKNLSIASTILGTTANATKGRKYWSERAIKYSKRSLGVLEGMMPDPDAGELEEVRTRLLIAMALNYYEDGEVRKEEISALFEKISKSFLVRTGFCNNMMLKSLHDDKIIKLPNYLSEKYI